MKEKGIEFFERIEAQDLLNRIGEGDETLDLMTINYNLKSSWFNEQSNVIPTSEVISHFFSKIDFCGRYLTYAKAHDFFEFCQIAKIGNIKMLNYFREDYIELFDRLLDEIYTDDLDMLNSLPYIVSDSNWSESYYKKVRTYFLESLEMNLSTIVITDLVELGISRRLDYIYAVLSICQNIKD